MRQASTTACLCGQVTVVLTVDWGGRGSSLALWLSGSLALWLSEVLMA